MSNIVDEKIWQRAKDIVKQMTLEEKLGLLTTHHSEVKRLGLSDFHIGTEVARGFVGREKDEISTVFPQPVGLASTFDTDLMLQLGEIAANEARAYYNDDKKSCLCLWGPTIDPVRDPRWGRVEEATARTCSWQASLPEPTPRAWQAITVHIIKLFPR